MTPEILDMEIPTWVILHLLYKSNEGILPEEMEVIKRFDEKYNLFEVGNDEYYAQYEPIFRHGRVRYGAVIPCFVHERKDRPGAGSGSVQHAAEGPTGGS
jgi:hypothetical protein